MHISRGQDNAGCCCTDNKERAVDTLRAGDKRDEDPDGADSQDAEQRTDAQAQ
jgi:hypothetical protein